MVNIWAIFKTDLRSLFRNVVSVIITVGLVVLPTFFCCFNILASWNVPENVKYLDVAIANNDQGYKSKFVPIKLNMGDDLIAALCKDETFHWVETDSEDAIEGAKSGKYYAVVVIPADFSKCIFSFFR
ncbi:MAG: hypothetical protein HUJ51_04685 [Eggerthellaceae bacterium]|nr:hypothetical protein [Eggerthellaceae bacterium]